MDRLSCCLFNILVVYIILVSFKHSCSASSRPIHKKKCAEYAEYVYGYIDDPTGISKKKVLMDNCVNVETLIHGGENATSREFPFMALVGFGPGPDVSWKCGGTLISENFVLSAAHCSYSKIVGAARWVRLGELDVSTKDDDATPIDIEIAERIVHEEYKAKIKYNDIALFRLAKTVTFGPYIRPICLYSGPQLDNEKSKITGWGATERGSSSSILQKADVKINREIDCKNYYNQQYLGLPHGLNWSTMVCAKGDNSKDTCRGDSGGPLFISITKTHYCMMAQVGVTSFGKECASNSPGVYTRVSAYIPWIEANVWPNSTA